MAGIRLTGFRSPALTAISALLVLISGSVLLFLSLFGPSFWYTATSAVFPIAGLIWFFRPFVAARLVIAPVLIFTPVFVLARPFGMPNLLFLAALLVVIWLIVNEFALGAYLGIGVVALSFFLVLATFLIDRLFTNKLSVETRWMYWAVPGAVPWEAISGRTGDPDEIELYRDVPGGYCTDSIRNGELRAHLAKSRKFAIQVQYNMIRDFGKLRVSTIRSVDGLLFIAGNRMYRNGEQNSGRVGAPPPGACP